MAKKKRRKLDQYLSDRAASEDRVLEEGTRVSNRLFRLGVGLSLTALLILIAVAGDQHGFSARSLGLALFVLVSATLFSLCLERVHPRVFKRPVAFNQFVLLILIFIACSSVFLAFSEWEYDYEYLLPLPLFAMIFAMTFTQGAALLISVGLSVYVGLMARGTEVMNVMIVDPKLSLTLALGSVTAVLGIRRVRRQSRPAIVGLIAGVVQALALVCIALVRGELRFDGTQNLEQVARVLSTPIAGLAGGVVSGVLLTSLLPWIESVLGILTERRLLDLADPSNKVLQALMKRASGTYQHSIGVSLLASGAADAIGADPLLARVGAYYHDIGKMEKPHYFVENMGEDKSIHERLRPSISKMIIISHVKTGIQFAKEAKLPQKIIDMIPMHHGTTVVEYFYFKARHSHDPNEGHDPEEVEYRYPGPKPRFREAALLMLADSVEARAKVESHPNPYRFRVMVHEEIHKRLLDGQLDESDLTLSDLRAIEDSFVRTLTTMYHGRIKYPGPVETKAVSSGDSGQSDTAEKSSAPAAESNGAARDPERKTTKVGAVR